MYHGKKIYSSITMGQSVSSLTICFIKKEGFKLTLKMTEGVCPRDLNAELVTEKKGLIAKGSASQITFGDVRNYQ